MFANEVWGAAVRAALEQVPMSRREIARLAGLSHTLLNRIAGGAGTTRATAERVQAALIQARDSRRQQALELRDESNLIQRVMLTTLAPRTGRRQPVI